VAAAVNSARETSSPGADWAWLSALIDARKVRNTVTTSLPLIRRTGVDEKPGKRDGKRMILSTKGEALRPAHLSTD
jgi:hypothetical protein